jgi:hypothetical protein
MVDWSPVLIALLSVGVGAVLGAALTYVAAVRLDERANKQKVSGLRQLVYSEIGMIYVALAECRDIIKNELEGLKNLNLNDSQNRIQTWMTIKERAETILETISGDWYSRATADPFIFIQLSDKEQRALRQIDLGQRAVIKKVLEQFTKIDERAMMGTDPTSSFGSLEKVLGTTIDMLSENIKGGFEKKLLLQEFHDENKWYVTLIFDRDKVMEGLPENATYEQIVKKAKELTDKLYSKNEGEQLKRHAETFSD